MDTNEPIQIGRFRRPAKFFLVLLGIVIVCDVSLSLTVYTFGLFFFDGPAGPLLLFQTIAVPLLLVLSFVVAYWLYTKKRYGSTTVIAGILSLGILLMLSSMAIQAQLRRASVNATFSPTTASATRFICPRESHRVLDVQGTQVTEQDNLNDSVSSYSIGTIGTDGLFTPILVPNAYYRRLFSECTNASGQTFSAVHPLKTTPS